MDRRENKDKTSFSLLLLGWRENEIKENEKKKISCLVEEKSENQKNVNVLNLILIINEE